MKAVRLRIVMSILALLFVTIVALQYGRNNHWQTEAVAAPNQQVDEKRYQYWFPFIGERNGRSYLSLIVREHNPAHATPTSTLSNTPSPEPLPTAVTPYPGAPTPVTPYPDPY